MYGLIALSGLTALSRLMALQRVKLVHTTRGSDLTAALLSEMGMGGLIKWID